MRLPICLIAGAFLAMAWSGTAQAEDPEFIGVWGCTSKCHKTEEVGDQRGAWQNSSHSEAYLALGTDKARERAAELGVEGDPQQAGECLICHTTGHGAESDRFARKFNVEDGVQCETCHGAGGDYRKKRIMIRITEERGPDRDQPSPTAEETGLHIPNEATCEGCHVEQIERNGVVYVNPSYKPFDFDERFKEVSHPRP